MSNAKKSSKGWLSEFSDDFFNLTRYEKSVIVHGAIWFFLILSSYYILRPIREQISATYGIENLSWLFWATFGVMLIAIPLYSYLVGTIHRRWLVPSIYLFFISNPVSYTHLTLPTIYSV